MPRVVNRVKKKEQFVRCLKWLKFPSHPKYKFFIHKSVEGHGYSVSEETSGACIVWNLNSMRSAEQAADFRLRFITIGQLTVSVNKAIKERKKLCQN